MLEAVIGVIAYLYEAAVRLFNMPPAVGGC